MNQTNTTTPITTADPEALRLLRAEITKSVRQALKRRPEITGSAWANKYFYLAAETATHAGFYRWERLPYQRELLDVMCNDTDKKVVLMTSARVGKSTCMKIATGYFMHNDPASILWMLPTETKAREWSQSECDPMLRDVSVLRSLVKDKRKRDSSNTVLMKKYTGGTLFIVGAESHTRTHGITARVYLADECARFPVSAGDDGDPIANGQNRVSSFGFRRKVILSSTPSVRGFCPIEREFLAGDQRYYYVRCPFENCNWLQRLVWDGLKFSTDDNRQAPEYECEACAQLIPEQYKLRMLSGGMWQPTNPEGAHKSYHISALYSTTVSWQDLRDEFVAAGKNRFLLKPFINQKLGETWNEAESFATVNELAERQEDYNAPFPTKDDNCNGAGVVGVGVDIQKDYIFLSAIAAGANDEYWIVDQRTFEGNTLTDLPWNALRDYLLNTSYATANGGSVGIRTIAIDARYQTQTVFDFVAKFRTLDTQRRSIIAVMGVEAGTSYIQNRPNTSPKFNQLYYPIASNIAKELFTAMLKNKPSETNTKIIHIPRQFPSDDPSNLRYCDNELLEQLTSEHLVTKFRGPSKGKERWEKKAGVRNEFFDTGIYAIGAIRHLGYSVLQSLPKMADDCAALRNAAKPALMSATGEPAPTMPPSRPAVRIHQPTHNSGGGFWRR